MPDDAISGLGWIDLLVVLGYLALLAGIAWRTRPRSSGSEDYFLAGRSIPSWAAACSLMATSLSAATFVGVPQAGYGGDLSYLAANIGAIIAVVIVAWLFIPAFYQAHVTTVYDLLGNRYGTAAARTASGAFLLGRVFASGARLYVAAFAISFFLSPGSERDPLLIGLAIAGLVLTAMAYVFIGGIRSVIWTDVAQAAIFVIAAGASIAVLLHRIPLDTAGIIDHLASAPVDGGGTKLTVFKTGFTSISPANDFGLLAIVLGMSLINLGAYGTDQDLAQRLLTCRDAKRGIRSAFIAIGIGIPVVFLFLIVGSLLSIYYGQPAIMGDAAPASGPVDSARVFLAFAIQELPAGLGGLIAAGLAAAAVSSLTSELNAMSSSIVADWYRPNHPEADDHAEMTVARIGIVAAGLALAGFATAVTCWYEQADGNFLAFAFRTMIFAYSGLVGVFLCRLLTRRGNWWSCITALLCGFAVTTIGFFGFWGDIHFTEYLAFPFVMTIATTCAFLVCLLGSTGAAEDDDDEAMTAATKRVG